MSRPTPFPVERIERSILALRGMRVMLDEALARLYGVEVRVLNQAVSRNIERFPGDFMFQLTTEEAALLRSRIVILETGRGRHRKYMPFAFTEHGVAMLSSVLRSPRAVQVSYRANFARAPTTSICSPSLSPWKIGSASASAAACSATGKFFASAPRWAKHGCRWNGIG